MRGTRSSRLCGLIALACALACSEATAPPPPPAAAEADLSRLDPGSAGAILQLLEAVRGDPGDAEKRAALGVAYELKEMLRAAEASYEQASRLDPQRPQWPYYLAMARARRGNFDGAIEALDAALALDDTYFPAHVRHGDWQLERGNSSAAEAAYEQALALAPDNAFAQVGLARVRLKQRRPDDAVALLTPLATRRDDTYFLNSARSSPSASGR